jgi:hypothetical protein
MRQESDRTRGGGSGQRREGRQNDARTSLIARCCNRSRFSSTASRGPYDMRWDCEAERCDSVDIGRMRSHATDDDEHEIAETSD